MHILWKDMQMQNAIQTHTNIQLQTTTISTHTHMQIHMQIHIWITGMHKRIYELKRNHIKDQNKDTLLHKYKDS